MGRQVARDLVGTTRACEQCGGLFEPYRAWQRFCPGGECRRRAWGAEGSRTIYLRSLLRNGHDPAALLRVVGSSLAEIARECGCGTTRAWKVLHRKAHGGQKAALIRAAASRIIGLSERELFHE